MMMTILRYSFVFLMFFICGCVHFHGQKEKTISDLEAEAIKALLINKATHYYNHFGTNMVIFISSGFEGWDGNIAPMPHHFAPAPKQWVKKMSIPNIEVKNVTESVGVRDGAALLVADKKTGIRGSIFRLEEITTISSNEVQIRAEFYSGFMQASGATWSFVFENGSWGLSNLKDVWIQ